MSFGLKIACSLFGVCSLAIALIYARYFSLPHPNEANRNQLGYWLVLKDLASEPPETRIALVNRLVTEGDLLADGDSPRLSENQLSQLTTNISILKKSWFYDRVEKYHKLPNEKRCDFLRQQIQIVNKWVKLSAEYPDMMSTADSKTQAPPAEVFFAEVDNWVEESVAEKREQAIATVNDAVYVWLTSESLAMRSLETRRELAGRIIDQLKSGTKIESKSDSLAAAETAILAANGELLMEAWMYNLADDLAKIKDRKERTQFVDQVIAGIQNWGVLELLEKQTDAKPQKTSTASMAKFSKKIQAWIDRAEPESQQKLKAFYSLAETRIIQRAIGSLF